jgi:hypothetical protein
MARAGTKIAGEEIFLLNLYGVEIVRIISPFSLLTHVRGDREEGAT